MSWRGNQDLRMFEKSDICVLLNSGKSGIPVFRILGYPEMRIPDFGEIWKNGKSICFRISGKSSKYCQNANFGDMDWTSDAPANINMTIVMDYAILNY